MFQGLESLDTRRIARVTRTGRTFTASVPLEVLIGAPLFTLLGFVIFFVALWPDLLDPRGFLERFLMV